MVRVDCSHATVEWWGSWLDITTSSSKYIVENPIVISFLMEIKSTWSKFFVTILYIHYESCNEHVRNSFFDLFLFCDYISWRLHGIWIGRRTKYVNFYWNYIFRRSSLLHSLQVIHIDSIGLLVSILKMLLPWVQSQLKLYRFYVDCRSCSG